MSVFQIATLQTGQKLADLTNLIQFIARKKPNDEAAQLRARAATTFYTGVVGFPKLTKNNDASKSPALDEDAIEKKDNRRLPLEIYQIIVDHLGYLDHATAQNTLVALSASCRLLHSLAQRQLYAYPRELDTIERQWKFRFALAVNPDLGNLAKTLQAFWLPTGENGTLLIDIFRACPNVKQLLVHRGKSLDDPNQITRRDVFNMAAMLDASPNVTSFWYSTIVEWAPEELRYEGTFRGTVSDKGIEKARFGTAASKLASLTFFGQTQWLLRALLPDLSPNFSSLALGQDISIEFNPRILSDLSLRSPHLKELEVRSNTINEEDLIEACKVWGPTLETLCISNAGEDGADWIIQIMPFMTALRVVSLGPGCYLFPDHLDAIAASLPQQRFKSISLDDLLLPQDTAEVAATQARLDEGLEKLIRAHSSTLESLELTGGRFPAGRRVFHSCKEAKRLESLWISPPMDMRSTDLDDLFNMCPQLAQIPDHLVASSAHPQKWKSRIRESRKRQEEEMYRDMNVRGTSFNSLA